MEFLDLELQMIILYIKINLQPKIKIKFNQEETKKINKTGLALF
jgi:hypothetical protein